MVKKIISSQKVPLRPSCTARVGQSRFELLNSAAEELTTREKSSQLVHVGKTCHTQGISCLSCLEEVLKTGGGQEEEK